MTQLSLTFTHVHGAPGSEARRAGCSCLNPARTSAFLSISSSTGLDSLGSGMAQGDSTCQRRCLPALSESGYRSAAHSAPYTYTGEVTSWRARNTPLAIAGAGAGLSALPQTSSPPFSTLSGEQSSSSGRLAPDRPNSSNGTEKSMAVALPAIARPPHQNMQAHPRNPRMPLINGSVAQLSRETCDLTNDITYHSEYAFAHGGFSDVYLGNWLVRHIGSKGEVVEENVEIVIKAIRAYTRERLDFERARRIAIDCAQRLNREVNILRRLSHPNIAEFLGIAFKQELRPCIIIKCYKNGITPKYIEMNPNVNRLALIKDIALGLEYLHTHSPKPIVHGDLKGCNTLVTDDGHAVITDFGLSRIIEEYSSPTGFTTTTFGGSIRWCAPELLFNPNANFDDDSDEEEDNAPRTPTLQSDIWGFACVAYELFTGLNPYPDDRYDWNIVKSFTSRNVPSTKRNSDGRDRWLKNSTGVFNLLRQCWSFTPASRPTIQVITQQLQNAVMAGEEGL